MTDPLSQAESEQYEQNHVHEVYNQIASHFSATRYKPWPIVEEFLRNLPDGAVGLDVGCGNGKYLTVNPRIFIIASDRSENLIKIASHNTLPPHTPIIADTLSLPHPQSKFDFAISIAVIHHLSTSTRRTEAISAILETLRLPPPPPSPPRPTNSSNDPSETKLLPLSHHPQSNPTSGRALIYVWALEQKHSRRGWDEGDAQDVMVPWVMNTASTTSGPSSSSSSTSTSSPFKNTNNPETGTKTKTFERYYHLYRRGELEADIERAGGVVEKSGYERDNWWAVCVRG